MPESSDDQRMQAAVDLSEGRPGEDAESLRRVGTRRIIVWRVAGLLVSIVAGIAVFLIVVPRRDRRSVEEVSSAQETLGTISSVAGMILIIGMLIWMVRTGRLRSAWRMSAIALPGRQRRDLRRQIFGRRPVVVEQLPITRELAREIIRQRPHVFSLLGITLTTLGGALTSGHSFQWFLVALVAALTVFAGVDGARTVGHARRFLAAHPAPDPPPSTQDS
jgi:hypothetical protein